ncbi:MAG: translation initiation factor IF-2 [Candidatus Berkelbacteria bacterium]|nr:translation initiation factor IF-2 [Candidatus Berkelbacteria bacterium]
MPQTQEKKKISLPEVVPVKLLAEELEASPALIVKKLLEMGVLATINESVDFDTAAIVADEYEVSAERKKDETDIELEESSKYTAYDRPPVVTVMGHVDHGKTKLLDAIRKTNVIETESGGITQHIGAYKTKISMKERKKTIDREMTFIDTPGHEAFSAMRAHGANITDIVILVVAADEGVKPQTIEAISHAKAAKVPIIVAINKIDKPEADPDRVKRELSEQKLIPEEWGGKTPMVPVSAKEGKNIDDLLETVILTADLEELKAPTDGPARGMVIESKVQSGKGATATVIIQSGTLKPSDVIVSEGEYAKVRFIEDWRGKRAQTAHPSDPVLVAGFKKPPKVGSQIRSVKSEKAARQIAEKTRRDNSVKSLSSKGTGLGEVSKVAKEEGIKELRLIIRADTKGSLEAIKSGLSEVSSDFVKISVISEGVGAVTESDINLASASLAVVLAFRASVPPQVMRLADEKKIKISKYEIIYELIDDIFAALEGMLEPEIVETVLGKLEVVKVFFKQHNRGIIGGRVISGKISPGTKITVTRNGQPIGELKTESIKIGAQTVNQVTDKKECGISYLGTVKLKPKDILEFVLVEERLRSLKKKI